MLYDFFYKTNKWNSPFLLNWFKTFKNIRRERTKSSLAFYSGVETPHRRENIGQFSLLTFFLSFLLCFCSFFLNSFLYFICFFIFSFPYCPLVAHDFATKFSLIEIYSVFLKDYERTVFVYFSEIMKRNYPKCKRRD